MMPNIFSPVFSVTWSFYQSWKWFCC